MTASLVLVLAVGAAYLAAHVAFDWLARRFLVVSAAEYLVLGILLGPQVSGLVDRRMLDALAPVVTLALGWIGAIVGTEFELRRLVAIPARRFRIAFGESAITLVVAGGLELLLLQRGLGAATSSDWAAAVTLGAMAVTSSGVGVAIVSRVLGSRGPLVEQLGLSARVNALVAIAVYGLLLSIHHAPIPLDPRPLTATEWAVVSVAIGVVGGALFHVFLGDTPDPDRLFVSLVGGVVLVSGAAAYLRLSPLLAGCLFGIVLVNTTPRPGAFVRALGQVERPFYYVLLLLGGAAWRPGATLVVLVFLGARGVAKIGASRLVARANGELETYGASWGRALLGQGRVALAIGLSYLHQADAPLRDGVFTAAVASILLTEFFSARLVRAAVDAGAAPAPAHVGERDTPPMEVGDADAAAALPAGDARLPAPPPDGSAERVEA